MTGGSRCSVCEETLVAPQEVAALGHDYQEVEGSAVAATCTKDGKKADQKCTRCDAHIDGETIEATGHKEEEIPALAATCTETGLTAGKKCSVCDEILEAQEEVAALGHDYQEVADSATAPTCTKDGKEADQECSRCHAHLDGKTIEATGHKAKVIPAVEPTCTETGLTEGSECSICHETLKVQEEVAALGHDYKDVAGSAVAATCTKDGKEADKKCTRCDAHIDGKTIEATGHKAKVIPAVEPTCTESGRTAGKKCSVCGEILETQEKIPAKGHTVESISAVEPTCTEPGMTAGKKCSICGETLEGLEEIEALGHDYQEVADSAVKPNCTKDGKEADRKCSRCGEMHDGATIPAKGHVWNTSYTVDKVATENEEGSKSIHCSICDEIKPGSSQKIAKSGQTNQKGIDGTSVGKGASALVAEKAIMSAKSDEGPAGTRYGILKLRSPKQTKKSITITWTKVKGAGKYVIYGNRCGKTRKMKKLATVTGKRRSFRKIAGKKVKKGTYYKFIVVALDKDNKVVSTSKVIHVAVKGGKAGNHKKVVIKKSILKKARNLKRGKTLKINARVVNASTLRVSKHRGIAFESSNKNVASVSRKGLVKAKKKGRCFVYAYAQNGVYKKIKIIVR